MSIPPIRIRHANEAAVIASRDWVLYWMTAFRRTGYNFALQHACSLAEKLNRPLLILEALRVRYRWASVRMHRFVIEGMRDNQEMCEKQNIAYYPYVEPKPGAGEGLLRALADRACVVVSDDFPCFFHPQMIRKSAAKLNVSMQVVDSNCLMPLAHADRTFTVAHSYRRWMQKELPQFLDDFPVAQPLRSKSVCALPQLASLPASIARKWPRADLARLLEAGGLRDLPIDASVGEAPLAGGAVQAQKLMQQFVKKRAQTYEHDRNEPALSGSSELSAHLHFGHIGTHEIFYNFMRSRDWNPARINKVNGKVQGFWGLDANAEAFLDQLCTWREIGFNMCWREPQYALFRSLPSWAKQTMDEHRHDPREYQYSLAQFEEARTHDKIWNAAQRQLVQEGKIHNYMRMLWGKKILHWSPSPEQALKTMLHLNNKYALDGRDPNSYSGIFWVLGRYDRAWGPERPIFGKIRYMTSDNTARKYDLAPYLERYR
ncbi:MAG: deoxyribodipyrimidine photolyase [Planctomycetales bacterium]|nr:deoxyribodipyrimidine photolyase [Planctomycetales bacterium]